MLVTKVCKCLVLGKWFILNFRTQENCCSSQKSSLFVVILIFYFRKIDPPFLLGKTSYVFFRALPERGGRGRRPLPEFFGPFFTMY